MWEEKSQGEEEPCIAGPYGSSSSGWDLLHRVWTTLIGLGPPDRVWVSLMGLGPPS